MNQEQDFKSSGGSDVKVEIKESGLELGLNGTF